MEYISSKIVRFDSAAALRPNVIELEEWPLAVAMFPSLVHQIVDAAGCTCHRPWLHHFGYRINQRRHTLHQHYFDYLHRIVNNHRHNFSQAVKIGRHNFDGSCHGFNHHNFSIGFQPFRFDFCRSHHDATAAASNFSHLRASHNMLTAIMYCYYLQASLSTSHNSYDCTFWL